eukprot:scaffold17780_cov71-Phaeocystis_antarctica.AAC.2
MPGSVCLVVVGYYTKVENGARDAAAIRDSCESHSTPCELSLHRAGVKSPARPIDYGRDVLIMQNLRSLLRAACGGNHRTK